MITEKYEPVIGLEVHIQLLTKSKVYSSDSTQYGVLPNTNVSVISLGHPGTLPKVNKEVIEYAVRLGLACHCDINKENQYARKNYFYTDLPKGYQISQDTTPICTGGYITIKDGNGGEKRITLTRIHMEEDSGKSIHDQDPFDTLIDLNRAGVPLLEMVSEPEIETSEDAYQYLTEIRKLVRYLNICDGNMEEGSLRCDANISVRLKGEEKLGEKVEVKNMNSIRNVQRAIEHEIKRQIETIENKKIINQETRSFDAATGTTSVMRTKEMADDYRYFPEPDLPMVIISQEYIDKIKTSMPPLPYELFKKFTDQLGLSDYDARVITEDKGVALYFEDLISHLPTGRQAQKNHKTAANWLMGTVMAHLNENAIEIEQFTLTPQRLALLIQLIDEGKVSNSVAAQKIFPKMLVETEKTPLEIAQDNNWIQESDTDSLNEYIKQAIDKYPEKVKEYKAGKKGLVGLFMGEVMKLSQGKADPKLTNKLVKEMLDES